MKILYITTVDCSQDSGVRKKIFGQANAMKRADIDIKIASPRESRISITDGGKVIDLESYSSNGPLRYFNMSSKLYSCAYKYIEENNFDGVFIRYSISDWSFLKMLRKLKILGLKIFIEIPSYPYDLEYANKQWYKKIGLYIDMVFRKQLYKYVDTIFTPSPEQKEIFGIDTVYFENGVDLASVPKRKYLGLRKDTLRFIGVANINAWHGYDRVIRGIAKYYKEGGEIDVIFNVVGEGVELPNLKQITKDSKIEDKIIFHGKKYGKELDEIYDNSDIAVSSIGFFRLNSMKRTSLKTREACLKAIPFISVKGDPIFDKDFRYQFLVEDRDIPIDIESIYNWFKELRADLYMTEMRKFAEKHLGWDTTFKDVILKIKRRITK